MTGKAQKSVASGVKRTVESPRMITGTTCGGGEMYRLPRGGNLEETFLLSQPHFTSHLPIPVKKSANYGINYGRFTADYRQLKAAFTADYGNLPAA